MIAIVGALPINPLDALEKSDHVLSIDEWARRLLKSDPLEYSERKPAQSAAYTQTREGRVAVMAERVRLRQCLRHPLDTCEGMGVERLAIGASRLRNGSVAERGILLDTFASAEG